MSRKIAGQGRGRRDRRDGARRREGAADRAQGASRRVRRRLAALAMCVCAPLTALALGASPALAVEGHAFSFSFNGGAEHALSKPEGLAIDQSTGEVYVVDQKEDRVEVFEGSGKWLASFGKKGTGLKEKKPTKLAEFEEPTGVAVDNGGGVGAGDVAVIDSVDKRVVIFKPNHEWLAEVTSSELNAIEENGMEKGGLRAVEAVAFDSSGNLWIWCDKPGFNEGTSSVYERSESGTLVGAFNRNLGGPRGLVVTAADELLFDNGAGVSRVDAAGEELEGFQGSGYELTGYKEDEDNADGLAFDPVSGGAYVDRGVEVAHFPAPQTHEQGPTDSFGGSGSGKLSGGVGIAVMGAAGAYQHDVYVADPAAHLVDVYAPVTLASATQEAVSGVEPTSVAVGGKVDPEGVAVSACEFEYIDTHEYAEDFNLGEAPVYAKREACSQTLGSGIGEQEVTASLSGLTEGQEYHVRLSVTDADGTSYAQQIQSVETPYEFEVKTGGAGAGTVTCEVKEPVPKSAGPCEEGYDESTRLRIEAQPDPGSTFEGWTVLEGPTACNGTTAPCEIRWGPNPGEAQGPVRLEARFGSGIGPKEYPLTVKKAGSGEGTVTSSPSGIDCLPGEAECSHSFTENEKVTLEESPVEPGSEFVEWEGCEAEPEGKCEVTMSAEKTVTATFNKVPAKYALTVKKAGSGEGTVTSSPAGIDCLPGEAECSHSFTENEVVTLKESPVEPGSEFAGWSGCKSEPSASECEVEMTEAKTVTATFNEPAPPVEYTLNVEKNGSGEGTVTSQPPGIACGLTCEAPFAAGTKVTLEESPVEPGSEFAGWTGCKAEPEGKCEVTMGEAKTVAATFNKEVVTPPVTYKTCAKVGKIVDSYEQEKTVKGELKFYPKTKEVYNGKYHDKSCTEVAPEPGTWDQEEAPTKVNLSYKGPEGKYELEPVTVELPYHFAGKNGKKVEIGKTTEGKPIYETQGKPTVLTLTDESKTYTVTCGKLTTAGEILNDTESSETVTLGKCELPVEEEEIRAGKFKKYKVPCTTEGAGEESGTIRTGTLDGALTEAGGNVYTHLTGASPFATFTCKSSRPGVLPVEFKVGGSLRGQIEGVTGKLGPVGAGAQAMVLTFDPAEQSLTAEVDGSPGYSGGLQSTQTQKEVYVGDEAEVEAEKDAHKGQLLYIEKP